MAKVLLIDDDAMLLKLYSEILSKDGISVLTANDAKKGFDLAAAEVPDLILLDIMMPEVDGTKVHESLSRNEKTKGIPIVFLTALVKEEEVEAGGGKIGGLNYISKSTPKGKFVAKVKEILSGSR
jgi:DNA-binding response OmpR family regulator